MKTPRAIGRVCIGALLAAMATPALAQDQGDLIVSGRALPNDAQTISMRVNYSDIDTGTYAGREELRSRVYETAADICRALRRTDTMYSDYTQCRDDAYSDAMMRVDTRYANYVPPDSSWLRRR